VLYFSAVAIFQALVERFAFLDYGNGLQDVGYLFGLNNDCLALGLASPRLPRLSLHPQRQHTAQPDGAVDVIGVGVAGARMEQDIQTVTIEHQPRQKEAATVDRAADTRLPKQRRALPHF
jgi:hypothetical protein